MSIEEIIDKYFKEENGFGSYKNIAIELFKQTIAILNEFNVDYFLISGTLLGHIRHQGLIPWDDDIDLLVDSRIINHLPKIYEKYKTLSFLCKHKITKVCFSNQGKEIQGNPHNWKDHILNRGGRYNWPFVDLFPYEIQKNEIRFFNKKWDLDQFFPAQKVMFLDINCCIPKNSDYFLRENYGPDYMIKLKSSWYSHKTEKSLVCQTINYEELMNRNKNIETNTSGS